MKDSRKPRTEQASDLMFNPGVLVSQSRYEALIRAETERDLLESIIKNESNYHVDRVLNAIQTTRKALRMNMSVTGPDTAGVPEARNDAQ